MTREVAVVGSEPVQARVTNLQRAPELSPATPGAPGEPLLAIRKLFKGFPGNPRAVAGVDLEVHGGEVVAILGANGSGKSTVLRCVARLIDPSSGSILVTGRELTTLAGAELRHARQAVGMVFQRGNLVQRRSSIRNAASGGVGRHRGVRAAAGYMPRIEMERAMDCLARVGVANTAHQRADQLSGGQAQRVAIARALVQAPRILLADEPVSSLDPDAAKGVMGVLADLAHVDGFAVVCVLHQPEIAMSYADRVVGMQAGQVAFDCLVADADLDSIANLYGPRSLDDVTA